MTVTARGRYEAKTTTVNLPRVRVQRYSETLPRVGHMLVNKDLALISFRTRPGPSLLRNGVEMLPSNIIRRGLAESYSQRSEGLANFGAISLLVEDMALVAEVM